MTGLRASTDTLILVTGGSRGFGRSLVEAASASGFRVATIARSPSAVTPAHEKVAGFQADCASDQALGRVEGSLRRLLSYNTDFILINNAGYYIKAAFDQTDPSEAGRTVESNLMAAFNVTKLALRIGPPRCIVNVVSSSALQYNAPRSDLRLKAVYGGSKRALGLLTESLIDEVPNRVRLINLYPRNINTWSSSEQPDALSSGELAQWVLKISMEGWPWHLTSCLILPAT